MGIICKYGDRGFAVKRLQKILNLYPDGIFGVNTKEAVLEFQKKNLLCQDGIVGLATWSKLAGIALQKKSSRRITEIIIHCTATPAGKDYTVYDIRKWHKQQGWSDIGYHYVVYRDGTIHEGRNINIAGAHTTGHNTHSIGIAYVGGMTRDGKRPADTRTKAQADRLENFLIYLRELYPEAKIYGHRDFANEDCPCFDARKAYIEI